MVLNKILRDIHVHCTAQYRIINYQITCRLPYYVLLYEFTTTIVKKIIILIRWIKVGYLVKYDPLKQYKTLKYKLVYTVVHSL